MSFLSATGLLFIPQDVVTSLSPVRKSLSNLFIQMLWSYILVHQHAVTVPFAGS